MSNPWLAIPLEDYEGHMAAPGVSQLEALAELFAAVLHECRPESVALLGVAGGNGMRHIDPAIVKRLVAVDINPAYLAEVRRRFGSLPGLELHCLDLSKQDFHLPPAALVHAALIFEHTGLIPALRNALSLVAPGGWFSVVLQLPAEREASVSATGFASMQTLKPHFSFIGVADFERALAQAGFRLLNRRERSVPGGKVLWLGLFASTTE